ncbi:MAG: TRAP transporter substrate-binding protein [Elusimicrobia bacterium]|nr:TRAP transporter substrate-binding protein [Elusimicrobiota bacterium]
MRKILAALIAFFIAPSLITRAEAAKYNIRWVMIHEPSATAEEAAHDFAERIEKASAGDIHVEVLTRVGYRDKYNGGKTLNPLSVMRKLESGDLEMCQTYTSFLGRYNRNMWALGLPYLFRDYNHAEKVFEGPIGKDLMNGLASASPLRGLAFTYSGGYGMFATKGTSARKPSDLKGLRFEIGRGFPYSSAIANALEIESVVAPPDAYVPLAKAGLVDGVETTFARFAEYGDENHARVVTNTEHFLLTTAIAINDKFFRSLPPKYQKMIEDVALETGRKERQHSIDLIRDSRQKLEKRGITVIDLTPDELAAYKKALEPVYAEVEPFIGPDIVQRIRDTKAGPVTAQR